MGYRPTRKLYEISYKQYPGLVVVAYGTTMGTLLETPDSLSGLTEYAIRNQKAILTEFIDCIDEWNVEHPDTLDDKECPRCGYITGALIPPTLKTIGCLDTSFVMDLFQGWQEAITRIPDPKEQRSYDGGKIIQEEVMRKLGELQNPLPLREPKSYWER